MKSLTIRNFEDLQNHLINIAQLPTRVEIDLSGYNTFIRPIFIVTIAQFIRFLRSKGYHLGKITLPKNTAIHNYLIDHVDFIRLYENNFEPTPVRTSPKTSLPLMSIEQGIIPDKKTTIVQFLRNYCPQKDLTTIEVCLDEILNNCFDHAHSQTGIIGHGQYHHNIRQIRLAVCDTGMGIPNCVNNYFKQIGKAPVSSEQAIDWAFEPSNTTQSTPSNRGRGLHTLHTAITACGGSYRVITQDKWLLKSPDNKFYRNTSSFFGTAIEFELLTDRLPDLEFADFDYEF